MKIRIELTDDEAEEEVIIRCKRMDDRVRKIHEFILGQTSPTPAFVFYKDNQEFYFPLDEILFFETEGDQVYAHTAKDAYSTKFRLYELEEILPRNFIRVAKATIVNTLQIYAVTRNITASSLVHFNGTHKQIYASRHYYQMLRQRLNERLL